VESLLVCWKECCGVVLCSVLFRGVQRLPWILMHVVGIKEDAGWYGVVWCGAGAVWCGCRCGTYGAMYIKTKDSFLETGLAIGGLGMWLRG